MTEKTKVCDGGSTLIFACSGAADVGALADQAARKMTQAGTGSMFCLAGIGGNVRPIMEKTNAADKILAIDGCPLACVQATLEKAGIEHRHLLVTGLGLAKGNSPVSEENIDIVVSHGRELI